MTALRWLVERTGEGHGLPAQLWALGVLHVEMLFGRAPFWEAKGLGPLLEASRALGMHPCVAVHTPRASESLRCAEYV